MHARELVELGALTALYGGKLLSRQSHTTAALIPYWTASKCRQDRWIRSLRKTKEPLSSHQLRGVLEEIFTGEILTRVWTAVTRRHDAIHQSREWEPIALSVLTGHLQARHRALKLLTEESSPPKGHRLAKENLPNGESFSPGETLIPHETPLPEENVLSMKDIVDLNRIRRRSERWTDLLLAFVQTDAMKADGANTDTAKCAKTHKDTFTITECTAITELAFETDRVLAFAHEMHKEKRLLADETSRTVLLNSLKTAFRQALASHSPNGDMNETIAHGVLDCFCGGSWDNDGVGCSLETVETFGLMESFWLVRLQRVVGHVEGLMKELVT